MKNLKNLRENMGFTQENIAKQIGVSQQAVAKWEIGESNPRADKLVELSHLLNCSIDDLLNYTVKAGESECANLARTATR